MVQLPKVREKVPGRVVESTKIGVEFQGFFLSDIYSHRRRGGKPGVSKPFHDCRPYTRI